jgi:hypothetical protein
MILKSYKYKRRALSCVSKNKHISDSAHILQVVSLTQDTLFSKFLARNFEFRESYGVFRGSISKFLKIIEN